MDARGTEEIGGERMMEIKEDKFYVLESENGKWLFESEDDAVKKLKDVKKNPDVTRVLKVDISKGEWSIKQVPWSKIAMKLMED